MLLVDTGSGVEVVYSCPQMFDRGGKPSAECSSGSEVQGMWQEFRRPGDLKSVENQKGSVQCSRSKRCKRSLAVHKCRPELHNATECMATTPPLQEGHMTKFFGSGHGRTRCVCVWGGGGGGGGGVTLGQGKIYCHRHT